MRSPCAQFTISSSTLRPHPDIHVKVSNISTQFSADNNVASTFGAAEATRLLEAQVTLLEVINALVGIWQNVSTLARTANASGFGGYQ